MSGTDSIPQWRGAKGPRSGQSHAGREALAWLSQCELCQRPDAAGMVIREAWRRQQLGKRWSRA